MVSKGAFGNVRENNSAIFSPLLEIKREISYPAEVLQLRTFAEKINSGLEPRVVFDFKVYH